MAGARDAALRALIAFRRDGAWPESALKDALRGMDRREAALATRLCNGVLQNRMLLDFYIGCWCSQKPNRLEPVILNILRIGGYQILFMDKIPHRAAVNEAVEMTKHYEEPEVVSFVNGILGSFVRAEFADSAPKPEKKEEEAAGPEEPEE